MNKSQPPRREDANGFDDGEAERNECDAPESDSKPGKYGGQHHQVTRGAQRQASAGARDGVKGKGALSLRALRCMR